MDKRELRATLNSLIRALKDCEFACRQSAEKLEDMKHSTNLLTIASQRAVFAGELAPIIGRFGGKTEIFGSETGGIAQTSAGLEAANDTDRAILEQAEQSENGTVIGYREALARDLPEDVRIVLERQYVHVQEWLLQLRAMRDSARRNAA